MRVSKNDTICGLAASAVRQLMRAYFDHRPVEVACDILGVAQDVARDQMRAFEAAGYVERGWLAHGAGNDWWATTVKGQRAGECELREADQPGNRYAAPGSGHRACPRLQRRSSLAIVRHGYDGIDQSAFHQLVRVHVAGNRYPAGSTSPGKASRTR